MQCLIRILALLLSPVLFAFCNQGQSLAENYFNEYGKGEFLNHTELYADSLLVDPYLVTMAEDRLILSDDGDYFFKIFHVSGDSLLYDGHFLQQGRGAYEMNIPKVKYDPLSETLYVYAPFNQENKCFAIRPGKGGDLYNPSSWDKYKLPAQQSRLNMELVNDSVYINIRRNDENRMFALTYRGKDDYFKSPDFSYPGDRNDIPAEDKALLYQGEIIKHPGRETFLYTCNAWKLIFIFDLEGENISNVRYISREEPLYKPVPDGFRPYSFPADSRMGCLRFFVTAKNIYLGYNPLTIGQIRNMETYKSYPFSYIDHINVFDWNGAFVKRLILDTPVDSFIVTPDDMSLYGGSLDMLKETPVSRILRFDLKKL